MMTATAQESPKERKAVTKSRPHSVRRDAGGAGGLGRIRRNLRLKKGQRKKSPNQDGKNVTAAASWSIKPTTPVIRMARSKANPKRRIVTERLMRLVKRAITRMMQ